MVFVQRLSLFFDSAIGADAERPVSGWGLAPMIYRLLCGARWRLDALLLCESGDAVTDVSFEEFVRDAEPRLRRALIGSVGADRIDDAVGEALAYAFSHWADVKMMSNPVGYLYRVGQSRTRRSKRLRLFRREPDAIPEVEPGLVDALAALPDSQRTAVWLAHGCAWTHQEIAEVLSTSTSTVATHVSRGLERLRAELGVAS
jgi:RNA polymerase sigma-70 factor (ECF subfamily)